MLEASRRLGAARGTVQARLDRMRERGVITGYGPEVDPAALGYEVTAFITLEIRQAGGHDPVAERLAAIPEVLEVHTITGAGDMLCRVVARTNADLQRVLDAIVSAEGVVRSSTLISLATQVPYRILPLVRAAAPRSSPSRSAKRRHDPVAERLSAIPEVLEVHTITGPATCSAGSSPVPTPTCSASSTRSSRSKAWSAPRP